MDSNKIKVFLKDSLIAIVLGIIYIIVCCNSIALVKIFPEHEIAKGNCGIRFLDYLYPTDLNKPPYSPPQHVCPPVDNTHNPPSNNCEYQRFNYAAEFGKMFGALNHDINKLEWPYNWLNTRKEREHWLTEWHKYKIANIIINQNYYSRLIMNSFLSLPVFKFIPDFLLFLAIPLAGTISSLTPVLPGLIYLVATLTLPVIVLVTIVSWIWFPLPTGKEWKIEVPGFSQVLMIILQGFGLLMACITGDQWQKSWGMLGWSILWGLLCVLAICLFIFSGGFLLILGLCNSTIIFIKTLLMTMAPLFLAPRAIFNVMYCNKDIIALILTAIITIRAHEQKSLNNSIINTMWGVWGLLLVMKIVVLIHSANK